MHAQGPTGHEVTEDIRDRITRTNCYQRQMELDAKSSLTVANRGRPAAGTGPPAMYAAPLSMAFGNATGG